MLLRDERVIRRYAPSAVTSIDECREDARYARHGMLEATCRHACSPITR